MLTQTNPGIYLIIEFDWPQPMDPEAGDKAYHLHQVVQGQTWIRECVTASGGIGNGPSSVWIFWLEDYAALDCLMRDKEDDVAIAYYEFFSKMPTVSEVIREEVVFLDRN